jgi:signal transduction histidine kinase
VSGLGAVAVGISFVGLYLEKAQRPAPGVGAAILALIVMVAAHRRFPPIAVLLVVAALDLATLGLTGSPVALRPLVAVALYLVIRQGERSRAKLAVSVGVAVVVAGIGAPWQDGPLLLEWASDAAVLALPIVVAKAGRSDRERRRSTLEREVAERVYAERLRIAADLHDVVAHSLSAIAVQSGIAEHLFERDPDGARRALADINTAGRRALDELRDLLGVLRSADAAPLRPVPGDPDDLPRVVAAALQAGSAAGPSGGTAAQWPVSVTVEGSYPPDTSEATVVAVHRIVH